MPRVEVGNTLNFRGGKWVIDRIGRHEETSIAKVDSDIFDEELRREGNTRYESKQIETFLAGDIITIKSERISLALPGADGYYIYTMFEVKKEHGTNQYKENEDAGSNTTGSKGADEHTPSESIEGPRNGVQDGAGIRESDSAPDHSSVHGSGQSGEGRNTVSPSEGEGG